MKLLNYTDENLKLWPSIGIYCITYINKSLVIYIGQAFNTGHKKQCKNGFYYRWLTHVRDLENNRHHNKRLQRIVNKYGLNNLRFHIIEILSERTTTLEQITNLETYYINYFKNLNYDVLNASLSAKSFKGLTHNKDSKYKMSLAHKGKPMHSNTYVAIMAANIGRKRSLETLQKQSEALKGRIVSEETKQKLSKALKGGKLKDRRIVTATKNEKILTFSSYKEAAIFFNLSESYIRSRCSKNKEIDGYVLSYTGETKQKNIHHIKPIKVFENGEYLEILSSMEEAIKKFNLSRNTLLDRIKNNKPVYKNSNLILKYL